MNVSIIEPVGGHGGNEFYDFGLCEHLSLLGVNVSLYTCNDTKLDERYKCLFIVNKYFVNIYGSDNKIIRGFRYIKGSIKSLFDSLKRKTNIAHFHIYHFSILELFNILLFRMGGIRCVVTIHDVESFEKYGTKDESQLGFKTKIILALSESIMVHSILAKQTLLDIGVLNEIIYHVPHGDTDFVHNKNKISKIKAREKLNLSSNGMILLFFGQIKAVKGLDILLKAMPKIDKSVRLLVVGKCWKQELDDYVQLSEKLNIDGRVQFINEYIPNEHVPYYFWASDFISLPYKKIYSSGVLLRAMDYSTTVICSDLPPLKAVINNQVTGLLFESENYYDLAKKVNLLVNNKVFSANLRTNAKNFVDENYSWNVVAMATETVYKKTLGEN